MKKFIFTLALATMTLAASAALTVKEAAGWQESAYMEFNGLDTLRYSKYNAYISPNGGAAWTQLDSMLIRSYGSYGRVDAVGLVAGANYLLKVVPCDAQGAEIAAEGVQSGTLTVVNYNREGFAHTGKYANTGVGAYNNDGSLKAGAVVLYITNKTVKTVSMTVTGATENPCVGLQAIMAGYEKGQETRPLAVRFIGEVKTLDYMGSTSEGLQVKGRKADSEMNITFEGIGNDAFIHGWGFLVRNCASVEMRNFGIATLLDDDISLDTDNDHVWIHNIDAFYGPNKGGDQKKGDGAIDVKGNSKHVTISYNHFWDTGKSTMCGMKQDNAANYITYHHNWFDHSDSRHARVRRMSVHMYNNYYDGIAKYGVGATNGCSVFMEANYFRNCSKPMLISMQGTDIHMGVGSADETKGTFSGEDGGIIKSFGNHYQGSVTRVTYQQNAIHFDCWEAQNRGDQVPATVLTKQGGTGYDNFDTDPTIMYTYNPDAATDVPANVTGVYGAGRLQHGDFQFTFTAADDALSEVNNNLRSAIDTYVSPVEAIIGVMGDGSLNPAPGEGDGPTVGPNPTSGFWEWYWSDDDDDWTTGNFVYSGNTTKRTQTITLLDSTEVTVSYGLKLETATTISFTAPSACCLKVIFQADQTGSIKLDDVKKTSTTNVLTLPITEGDHTLTKGDSRNIYYMALYDFAEPTALENVTATETAIKVLREGRIYILRGEEVFTIDGRRVK